MRSTAGFVGHIAFKGFVGKPLLELKLTGHLNFLALKIAIGLSQKKVERLTDVRLQFFAGNHGVKEPVLEEKFGGLKSFGQLLADGLLDHARPGKSNQRARL